MNPSICKTCGQPLAAAALRCDTCGAPVNPVPDDNKTTARAALVRVAVVTLIAVIAAGLVLAGILGFLV
jgi:hypothetical protein